MLEPSLVQILIKLNQIDNKLSKLQSMNPLLTRREMCETMKVSIRTFDSLAPDMVHFGLKKIGGQWRMEHKKFDTYLKSLEI